eukprot:gene4591-9123_t
MIFRSILGLLPCLIHCIAYKLSRHVRESRGSISMMQNAITDNFYTDIGGMKVSKLGIGTWAWGDALYWNYNATQDSALQATFNISLDYGVNLFDTAEIYGNGKSELLVGRFLRQYESVEKRNHVSLATKFAPNPLRVGKESVIAACKDSLDRLGVNQISLYQIHFPGLWQNEAYWDGLAECYHQGLVRAVGVSNYGPKQMINIHKILKSRGVPLATNQVPFSLLSRSAETNGVLRTAQELGVKVIAYSPLAQGILTGKFNNSNLPTGPRSLNSRVALFAVSSLLREMSDIAEERGKSMSQIALNWCIAKGTIPIPGARTVAQAIDNCGALGWDLEREEVLRLDLKDNNCGSVTFVVIVIVIVIVSFTVINVGREGLFDVYSL